MRVLVTGDRNWTDQMIVDVVLDGFQSHANYIVAELMTVIDGAARGADTCGHRWATDNEVRNERYPAKWDEHGKAAGPIRNALMLKECKPDFVLAFHNDLENSKGTKHMVTIARKAGVPVYHVRSVA